MLTDEYPGYGSLKSELKPISFGATSMNLGATKQEVGAAKGGEKFFPTCPTCICGQPTMRNHSMETLMKQADIHFVCKFASSGCRFKGKTKEVMHHENQCDFRQVPCPYKDCKEHLVPFNKIMDHLKGHSAKFEGETESGNCIKKVKMTPPFPLYKDLYIWKYQDQHFLCKIERSPQNLLNIWVYIIGSPSLAEDFKVTLVYKNGEKGTLFYISRKCSVVPIDTKWEDVLRLGDNTLEISTKQEQLCLTADDNGKVIFVEFNLSCI